MTHTLNAKEQPLDKIFSGDYVFSIPGYQRPYSWTTDQAQELLDDLVSFMTASGDGKLDQIPPYFLGSIVLIKREAVPEATVVDGQQRLTTLTLLLSAIRATITNQQVKAGITKRIYEQGDVVSATENHYRLSLRERDREFFRNYVQHEDGIEKLAALNDKLPDSQQRLRENAKLFLNQLAQMSDAAKQRLVQFIITRCYLVTVATPDLDSAYRIFGVLNSRGLDLSATDILKAEIIGNVGPDKRDEYTTKWEDLEDDIGRDAFGDLFGHIRMVYRKAKPQGTLLKEFREHVGPNDPVAFIDKVLEPMALAFQQITDAAYSSQHGAEKINERLHWLNKVEFKDWLPPALVFFSNHRNDPDAMLRFFGDLERLAYSMLVRRTGVNGRIERFSKLTFALEIGIDPFHEDSPLQLSPAEQFETYEALDGPIYEALWARARSVLMLRLDTLLSAGGAQYDYDTITVEHVLPQTPQPGSQWLSWFPQPQDRVTWVHRLGNLALLTRKKNSAASNFEFIKKKNAYFTNGGVSPFSITTQVIQYESWTPEVVAQRQAQLLGALERHWRLEGREDPKALLIKTLESEEGADDTTQFELKSVKHGLYALARQIGDQFVVLKGSKAAPAWTAEYHSYQPMRQKLVDSGVLVPDGNGALTFAENASFNSPSAASAAILGRPDNGRTSWLVRDTDVNYGEWAQEGQTNGQLDLRGE